MTPSDEYTETTPVEESDVETDSVPTDPSDETDPENPSDTENGDSSDTEAEESGVTYVPSNEALLEEIRMLRELLAAKEQERQLILRELAEFYRLFPHVSLEDIPEEVWDSVENGIPLAAAYALYEKKRHSAKERAGEINRRNASLSAGKAGKNTKGEYFSPDEVRTMSQRQVHQNYHAIMESMKHWH